MSEGADRTVTLERQLRLAHQSRRASEHLLDGIRRALCDAGFMEDGDPFGHADLADVIRQAAEVTAEPGGDRISDEQCATCRHPKQLHDANVYRSPCMTTYNVGASICDCMAYKEIKAAEAPCGHCGCEAWDRGEAHPEHPWRTDAGQRVRCNGDPPSSWPTVSAEPTVTPLTRAAVRTVVSYVGSLVGWIDEVHGDLVDQITDAALAKISGAEPAACPNLPGHETHSPPCGFTGRPLFGDRVRVSFVTTFDKRDSTGRYMLVEPAGTVLTGGATVEVIGRAADDHA